MVARTVCLGLLVSGGMEVRRGWGCCCCFLPDWTDHWVSGAAGGGAALVAAVGVSFVSVLAFEVGFSGDGGADMIVLYCSLGLSFSQLEYLWL